MTFGEMYAECANRLQGRTWNLSVDAGSYSPVRWRVYVEGMVPCFADGSSPEAALTNLTSTLSNGMPPQTPEDVGPIVVGKP